MTVSLSLSVLSSAVRVVVPSSAKCHLIKIQVLISQLIKIRNDSERFEDRKVKNYLFIGN
jgi:hypothetical protein